MLSTDQHTHLWQSRVKNEHYSVAYYKRMSEFKLLNLCTSIKGGAHTLCEK